MLLHANHYYSFGFNVTRIGLKPLQHPDAVAMKSPSHEWEHWMHERQTVVQLQNHDWSRATGVGVVLGYNRLRALDIDGCKDYSLAQEFLKTLGLPSDYEWLVRSGKGFHILFYADDHEFEKSPGAIKVFLSGPDFRRHFAGIELRWIGHLVLPPSLHPSFRKYRFVHIEYPMHSPAEVVSSGLKSLVDKYCSWWQEVGPYWSQQVHEPDGGDIRHDSKGLFFDGERWRVEYTDRSSSFWDATSVDE